jgi:penicillin-binding protein 2
VTGIAALSEEKVKPDESVRCSGGLPYGNRVFHCWGAHGPISYHRSLVHSCDVYYYVMGLRLGPDLIAKYANELGLGKNTGIELKGERSGLIPTEKWKEKRFGVPWQKGENLSISVGQGYDLVTPLQNAMMIAQVVNGGYRIQPHLVEAAYDPDGHEVYKWKAPNEKEKIDISAEVLEMTKKALAGVVQEGGTAGRLVAYEVEMGGKTGTAQVVSLDTACAGEKCRDHAWFVGFAPTEKPEIAAAVVVEHGGFGASAAAPIVGAIMQRYMDIVHGTKSKHPALSER